MPDKELMLDHEVALKRKRTSRVIAFSLLGIVLALVVLIIVGACVKVNLKPYIAANHDRVTIYNQNSVYGQFDSDQEKYQQFMQQFDEIFETSFLVALFSGRLGDYQITGQQDNQLFSTVESQLKNGYYVEFKYDLPQTVTYNDGSAYKDIWHTDQTLSFTSLYFAISQTDELSTLDIYVAVKYKADQNSQTYALKISQKANTYVLYDSLADYKTY